MEEISVFVTIAPAKAATKVAVVEDRAVRSESIVEMVPLLHNSRGTICFACPVGLSSQRQRSAHAHDPNSKTVGRCADGVADRLIIHAHGDGGDELPIGGRQQPPDLLDPDPCLDGHGLIDRRPKGPGIDATAIGISHPE